MKNLYLVRQIQGGEAHVVYAECDELEGMYQSGIINEYTYVSEEKVISEYYFNYFKHAIDTEVNEIMANIQDAKGIMSGDCPPELNVELDDAIMKLWSVVWRIIQFEEANKEE